MTAVEELAVIRSSAAFLDALKASVPVHDDIPAPVVQKPRRGGRRKAA